MEGRAAHSRWYSVAPRPPAILFAAALPVATPGTRSPSATRRSRGAPLGGSVILLPVLAGRGIRIKTSTWALG